MKACRGLPSACTRGADERGHYTPRAGHSAAVVSVPRPITVGFQGTTCIVPAMTLIAPGRGRVGIAGGARYGKTRTDENVMRVFIAVDLPNELRKELGEIERQLKPLTDTARWVAPESIHITLKFIGEVPEKRAEDIDSALTGLTWIPFTITVRGVGFFPGNRSPRVFWAGMEAPTMQDLAEELDSRMERSGFEKEKRAFRPHITLARARDSRSFPAGYFSTLRW